MCKSEKEWIKCPSNNQQRNHLKHIFIEKRKLFDKVVQRSKRRHWKEMQEELLNSCKSNSKDFWKKIGRIGVGGERNRSIPKKTETPDGHISFKTEDVLNKWKRDFESLYNNTSAHQNIQVPENNNNMSRNTHGTTNEQYGSTRVNALNTGITILEVKEAVKSLHKNRAVGQDQLPAEVLQSDSCIFFLHRLFLCLF